LTQNDIDWSELNGVCRAVAGAVINTLGLDPAKVNPMGARLYSISAGRHRAICAATVIHAAPPPAGTWYTMMRRRLGRMALPVFF
jgi:acetyl-CoA acyltransferase